MVDILERLRSPQTSLGTLWPQPNLHEESADEITRLREENAAERLVAKDNLDWFNALKTDYDALREENARLREALKPFANELKEQKVEVPHVTEDERFIYSYTLRVKHLRAAAAAIREGGNMTKQEREELIEKMARAAWESDGVASWKEVRKNGKKLYLREASAALDVAEPVIREQADNALREENARLREAVKAAYFEGWYRTPAHNPERDWEASKAAAAIREGGGDE